MKNGIILINKPVGISSHAAIKKVQKKIKAEKIGHAGTLDPLATGLLIVLVNSGTKLSDYMLLSNKKYDVEMRLFMKTDSGDLAGKIILTDNFKIINNDLLQNTFEKFNNKSYNQTPPMYSALKLNGKKLYEYARNNSLESKINLDSKRRLINIFELNIIKYSKDEGVISFTVFCSKGTYIRSLVEDLANDLNTIAVVQKLTRISSGEFNLFNAKNIEDVNENDIIPSYNVLTTLKKPIITITDNIILKKIYNGQNIILNNIKYDLVFIADEHQEMLAIYQKKVDQEFKCLRRLN